MLLHTKSSASKTDSAARVRTVRAVERAFDILIYIAHQDEPKGLSEISRELQLDKATVLRLIVTLKSRGLIRQIQESRSYEVVLPGPLLIGGTDPGLRQMCHPYLDELSRRTKETVCLVCPWGLERTHVDVIPAQHELRLVPEIGSIWPMYVGASGRVMMAFMPRHKVEEHRKRNQARPAQCHACPRQRRNLRRLDTHPAPRIFDQRRRNCGGRRGGRRANHRPQRARRRRNCHSRAVNAPHSRVAPAICAAGPGCHAQAFARSWVRS